MAESVVVAAENKYLSLLAANFPGGVRPPIYLDEPPRPDEAGDDVYPPYVVYSDAGLVPAYDFEMNVIEASTLTFTAYADTLADCDTIAAAIKYNGGDITAGVGFDNGTLPGLTFPHQNLQVRRTGERRFFAGIGKQGQRVHAVELKYAVALQRFAL